MSRPQSVTITGIGAATPLGNSFTTLASNLLAGRSGIQTLTDPLYAEHPTRIGGKIEIPPCPALWDSVDYDRMNALERLAFFCGVEALQDAGLWEKREELRIGLVLGNATEWIVNWEMDHLAGGQRLFQPQSHMPTMVQVLISKLGLRGPGVSLSSACASGNHALMVARRWLDSDWVDVCLAGACDLTLSPCTMACFGNLRALSRRNDQPTAASRPFDKDRDGFVMGEGGVILVMEREDSSRRRNASVYGRIIGSGCTSDAHNMVIPSPDPTPSATAMRQALKNAGLNPEDIDYVNAHATSTPIGDRAESRSLARVFDNVLQKVPVSSTKSMTGHLLTAAAAVETLACLAAIRHQAVPPTINLHNPDPECPLCHVANEAQPRKVKFAMSNSFGFGGSNTCVVLAAA